MQESAFGVDIPDDSAYPLEVAITGQRHPDCRPGSDEAFMYRLLRTKHGGRWSYEQESRMFIGVKDRPDEQGLKFMDFAPELTLSEVIFGVNCENLSAMSRPLPSSRISSM